MTPITPSQLQDWRRLAEAVSPLPGMVIRNHTDWEFYDAAQIAVPVLCEEVERLREALSEIALLYGECKCKSIDCQSCMASEALA